MLAYVTINKEAKYGADALQERLSRQHTHRIRSEAKGRKDDIRPKQGNTWQYNEWRRGVFTRDNHTCQHCSQIGGSLNAHHIRAWSKFPEDRFNLSNGITLCLSCHVLEHKNIRGGIYAN